MSTGQQQTEPTTALAAIEQEQRKTEIRARVAVGERGVVLQNLDDFFRFAQWIVEAKMAPKGMDSPAAVVIAMQLGAELGLSYMAAIQNIAPINGRPTVWGDAMLALCRQSGKFDEQAFEEKVYNEDEGIKRESSMYAEVTVRRLPDGRPIVQRFSIADAYSAGLLPAKEEAVWAKYPQRMLKMRARSWALRDAFGDVLKGLYSAEESLDAIDVESRPAASGKNLDEVSEQLEAKKAAKQNGNANQAAAAPAPVPETKPTEKSAEDKPAPSKPADKEFDLVGLIHALNECRTIAEVDAVEESWLGRDAQYRDVIDHHCAARRVDLDKPAPAKGASKQKTLGGAT